jgi:hypothetical protein
MINTLVIDANDVVTNVQVHGYTQMSTLIETFARRWNVKRENVELVYYGNHSSFTSIDSVTWDRRHTTAQAMGLNEGIITVLIFKVALLELLLRQKWIFSIKIINDNRFPTSL